MVSFSEQSFLVLMKSNSASFSFMDSVFEERKNVLANPKIMNIFSWICSAIV